MLSKKEFNQKIQNIYDNLEVAKECDKCKDKLLSTYEFLIGKKEN